MSGAAATYGLLLFLPVVLRRGLGYSQTMSYLLAAPPAAAAVAFTFTVSWLSDRYHIRGPFVVLEGSLAIVGLCMIGFLDTPTPRYVGSFLGSSGSNALIVTAAAWGQNNIRGDAKRSVTAATQVMSAGLGGIYSALVFRQQVRALLFWTLRSDNCLSVIGRTELCAGSRRLLRFNCMVCLARNYHYAIAHSRQSPSRSWRKGY